MRDVCKAEKRDCDANANAFDQLHLLDQIQGLSAPDVAKRFKGISNIGTLRVFSRYYHSMFLKRTIAQC
jgi:hypothetical protein